MQVSQNEENSEVVSGVRETSGGGAKKSEENGHVSDTLAWESRIADRELPICRTIASLALTSPFILTPGRLLSREWGSLILPRRERTYSVAWLQSGHTTRSRRLSFPGNRTETEFANAQGLCFPYFSFRKIETDLGDPSQFRMIEYTQLKYANITFATNPIKKIFIINKFFI